MCVESLKFGLLAKLSMSFQDFWPIFKVTFQRDTC